jgi:hypothetical protein
MRRLSVVYAWTTGILSFVVAALVWLLRHQAKAMVAQKSALEATRATCEALKIQSDLRVEPLRQTVDIKNVVIKSLRA